MPFNSPPTPICRNPPPQKTIFPKNYTFWKKNIVHIILLSTKLQYYFLFLHFPICKIPTIIFNYSAIFQQKFFQGGRF